MIRTIVIATALVLAATVICNAAAKDGRGSTPTSTIGSKAKGPTAYEPYDPSAGSVGFKKPKKKTKPKPKPQ